MESINRFRYIGVTVVVLIFVLLLEANLYSANVGVKISDKRFNYFQDMPQQPIFVPAKPKETAMPEWKQELFKHYRLAILTTKKFHDRVQYALGSWWEPEYSPIIEVLSDSTNQTGQVVFLPNLFDTGCPNSYNFGLWCKNYFMLKRWLTDPQFKDVKWFYRGMDDSWLHMENMVWFLSQYDHRKPLLFGERVCYHTNRDYPDGGPGIFMSRGFLEVAGMLDNWNKSLAINHPNTIFDDVIYGIFNKLQNSTLVHYTGISHHSLTRKSQLYNYMTKQKGGKWPVTFRPIAFHQMGKEGLEFMKTVNEELHSIDYGEVDDRPFTMPNCWCAPNIHRRCSYQQGLNHNNPCDWANGHLKCLAPEPWPRA